MEELRCLGSWKEGSTHYFLGLMNHSRVTSEDWEGRFRCFAYQGGNSIGLNLSPKRSPKYAPKVSRLVYHRYLFKAGGAQICV